MVWGARLGVGCGKYRRRDDVASVGIGNVTKGWAESRATSEENTQYYIPFVPLVRLLYKFLFGSFCATVFAPAGCRIHS